MIRGICCVSCIVSRLQWAAVFKRSSSSIWRRSTAPKATRNDFMRDAIRVGLKGEPLAKYEAALEDYKRYLAEWRKHVEKATTYSDVCMKPERDGELLPMPWVISALGELKLAAPVVLALEYRCACACVSCGRMGTRASTTGAMRRDGCAGR